MAIICDNDMEIILKGSAEEVIRKMLKDRLFALIKMPAKKPEKYTSEFTSSVFVGFIGNYNRTFAIRPEGTKTVYEDCEYYLMMFYKRGTDEDLKREQQHRIFRGSRSVDREQYPGLSF